jgi:putative oxidoreductase
MSVETMGTSVTPQTMPAVLQDFLLLVGRVLIGWIFVRSGWGKVMDLGTFAASMPGRGGLPTWLGYIAGPVEVIGGAAVILGLYTRWAALLMLVFTVAATLSTHRYWEFTEAAARRAQDTNFYKNVAIMGGFFFLMAAGGGRWSLDGILRKRS